MFKINREQHKSVGLMQLVEVANEKANIAADLAVLSLSVATDNRGMISAILDQLFEHGLIDKEKLFDDCDKYGDIYVNRFSNMLKEMDEESEESEPIISKSDEYEDDEYGEDNTPQFSNNMNPPIIKIPQEIINQMINATNENNSQNKVIKIPNNVSCPIVNKSKYHR